MILSLLIVILITFLAHPEVSIAFFFFGGAQLRKDGWNLPTISLTFNRSESPDCVEVSIIMAIGRGWAGAKVEHLMF